MISLFFLLLGAGSGTVAKADLLGHFCYGRNYTTNGTFHSNLELLLSSLSASNADFTTKEMGAIPDRAYGLILCRGDVLPSDCGSCIENAARDVLSLCPLSKQATVWYDGCQLRYDDRLFFSTVEDAYHQGWSTGIVAADTATFVRLRTELLDEVVKAVLGNSSLMFATGVGFVNASARVYALAQCTRDLSVVDCGTCLQQMRTDYGKDDKNAETFTAGSVHGRSCNFRYDSSKFFGGEPIVSLRLSAPDSTGSPPPELPSPTPTPTVKEKINSTVLIIIAIPVAVALMLINTICLCIWRKRSARLAISGVSKPEKISSIESILFDLSVIKAATSDFSDVNKLGQGGFGAVYKGKLSDGKEIAVKRLSKTSKQGLGELKNELLLVAQLHHKNLVKLLGACLEEEEKLLVYEHVPNRSLDLILFDDTKKNQLNWEMRTKIIRGVARGLVYLHEESPLRVIHRDLKASNVLLDVDMNPKISDFGLAKLYEGDETHCTTSRVVGTFGYMAPEYARHRKISTKLDVYSFGILVLEIVAGRTNSSFDVIEYENGLLSYAYEHWSKQTASEILDPSLGQNCPTNEVLKCIQIGLLCTQGVAAQRPQMSEVVYMLHGSTVPFPSPLQPTFTAGMMNMRNTLLEHSANEVTISELDPR